MSRQRGASVLAAIILILVFALAALIISVFFPKTSADSISLNAAAASAPASEKCMEGKDFLYIFNNEVIDKKAMEAAGKELKSGGASRPEKGKDGSLVTNYCPAGMELTGNYVDMAITRDALRLDKVIVRHPGIDSKNKDGNVHLFEGFDRDGSVCLRSGTSPKFTPKNDPKQSAWKCRAMVCIFLPNGTNGNFYECSTHEIGLGERPDKHPEVQQSLARAVAQARVDGVPQGGTREVPPILTNLPISTVSGSFGEQIKEAETIKKEAATELDKLQKYVLQNCDAGSSGVVAGDCEDKQKNISSLQQAVKDQDKILERLKADQVKLDGGNGPPAQTGNGGGNGGGGGVQPPTGSNTFRDLGNMAQSMNNALGGQCGMTTVCQNGMLMRQVPMQGYGNTQGGMTCQMQPLQQCPYGCAQSALNGGSMSTGQQLSLIGTGMSLAGRLFGGSSGTNNNSSIGGVGNLASIGMSSQCATQQQAMQQMQQQSPYGIGQNGYPCTQPPAQPSSAGCTVGAWKQTADNNGCAAGWQCIPNGTGTDGSTSAPAATQPLAQLSCEPKSGEAGTSQISLSYNCANSTTASAQEFTLNGAALNGTVRTQLRQATSSTETTVNYSLTCANAAGVTSVAQCSVKMVKPGIVFVINPLNPKKGSTANLGWVTAGMQSCKISSDMFPDWTQQQAKYNDPNGVAQTPAITQNSPFKLSCTTIGGNTKESQTTILPQN